MAAPGFIAKWAQYLGARFASFLLSVGDVNTNLRIMAGAGKLLYAIDKKHRRRILANLGVAFPHLAQAQLEDLGSRAFQHFTKLLVEVAVTPRLLHADTWPLHVNFADMGHTMQILNANKPAIVLTGHVGNWEMLGFVNALMGYPVDAIARPIDNLLINHWMTSVRERRGLRIITKWDATERMMDVIDSGGALGFVADQNAGERGMFVPFFNRLASTYKSIGILAMRKQVPVVCGFCRRTGDGFHYEISTVDLIQPRDWEGRDDPLFYITARYMRAIETMVRRAPEQYLWMHRRWKSRPRWEREGKPMPANVQKSLEELPWMDQATMEQLKLPAPTL